MRRLLCGSWVVVGGLFASVALAEDAVVAPGANAGEIEVVVSASRGLAQNPLDVPQAVTAVSRAKLEESEYSDVDDALRVLSSVGGVPHEGNPNYWQEGFTIRGLGAQRVLTLTDGIRQAGQGIGYGGGNLSLYDPLNIERIEVLRGPASVLYGTDAFGGVVNIVTREPKRRSESGSNASVRGAFDGQRDLYRVGSFVDFGDKEYGVALGGSYVNSGEPNLPGGIGEEDPKSGSFRRLDVWGKADFFVTDDTKVRLVGNLNRNSDVLVTDTQLPLPIAVFGRPGSSVMTSSPLLFQFPEYRRSVLGAEVDVKDLGSNWESFKTGVYWLQLARQFHRETSFYSSGSPGFSGPPLFVDPTSTVTTSVVDTDDKVNTIESQTQARYRNGAHLITVGFDMGWDSTDLPETEVQQVIARAGPGLTPGKPTTTIERNRAEATQWRFGAYAQDSWNVAEATELVPGVRLDYHTITEDQTDFDDDVLGLSGSLGTLYHVTDQDSAYLTLAAGFRAPDLGERFQNGIVNLGAPTRIIGQADLDPERSVTTELGVKGRRSAFSYDFATFWTHVDDFIGTTARGVVDGFQTDQYANLGGVELYGVEASGRVNVTDSVSFFLNTTRTWTDQRTKVDVANWIFNYGVEYAVEVGESLLKSLQTGLRARSALGSEQKTTTSGRDRFDAAGFTTLDLYLNLNVGETALGKVQVVSGVRNLLDKRYKEPFFVISQPERGVYAGVQIDW